MGHQDAGAPRRGTTGDTARASRLAQLERRAARARRRLLLTLVLVLGTAVAWVLVAIGTVGWYAGAAPSVLLLAVLITGSVAARAGRRADAHWTAERRTAERRAAQARTLANGGPYAPRNRARVTGHAVHGSSTHTQMIPRVAVAAAPAELPATATLAEREDGGGVAEDQAPAEPRPSVEAPAETPATDDAPAVDVPPARRPIGGEPWVPVPVPLPTYVTKPAAPRREPRPLTGATPAVAARLQDTMNRALGATTTPARADATAGETPSGTPVPAGDEPRPRTETLGLPLDQILARRRAAG
jgi:hypothetical protein